MIIDRLVLDNFAVYAGRQEMILTPPSKDRPVILVHGLNGTGKTSLLDSLHLAFYGSRARTSNRGRLAYRDYLRASIHHDADPEQGAKIEVEFRRRQEGKENRYLIRRSWRETDGGEVEARYAIFS